MVAMTQPVYLVDDENPLTMCLDKTEVMPKP